MNYNDTVQLYIKVLKKDIGYLDCVFESLEGYAVVRTIDAKRGHVVLMVSPNLLTETYKVIENLKKEMEIKFLPFCEV